MPPRVRAAEANISTKDMLMRLSSGISSQAAEGTPWDEIPVDFRIFVESETHQHLPPLSPVQYKEIEAVIGTQPEAIFDDGRPVRIGVYLWGKGSGKDYVSSLVVAYITYILLCLKDPMSYLNPVPDADGRTVSGEDIDIINVAYSKDQAKLIFFKKLTARYKNWPWLARKFTLVEDNRVLNERGKPEVKIADRIVTFPVMKYDPRRKKKVHLYDIRALSMHSAQESYEGHNIICWIMDEAAAFINEEGHSNAHSVYSTLRTSAHSRFPNKWIGFMLSYPRHSEDFIMEMYEVAQRDPRMHASRYAPWEVNPTKKREHYDSEFAEDPEDANKKYLCLPPKAINTFMDTERVGSVFTLDPEGAMFQTEEQLIEHEVVNPDTGVVVTHQFIGRVITSWRNVSLFEKVVPHVVWIDQSLSGDWTWLILAHGKPMELTMKDETAQERVVDLFAPVIDAIVFWEPDKRRKLLVSLNSVDAVLNDIMDHGIKVSKIGYDQWNSANIIERLMGQGIYVENHNIKTDDYIFLKRMIHAGAAEVIKQPLLQYELEHLQIIKDKKVDHPKDAYHDLGRDGIKKRRRGSKDGADCLAGVTRLLNPDPKNRDDFRIPHGAYMFPATMQAPNPHGGPMVGRTNPLHGMPPWGPRQQSAARQPLISPAAQAAISAQGQAGGMGVFGPTGLPLSPLSRNSVIPQKHDKGRVQRPGPGPRTFPASRPGPM